MNFCPTAGSRSQYNSAVDRGENKCTPQWVLGQTVTLNGNLEGASDKGAGDAKGSVPNGENLNFFERLSRDFVTAVAILGGDSGGIQEANESTSQKGMPGGRGSKDDASSWTQNLYSMAVAFGGMAADKAKKGYQAFKQGITKLQRRSVNRIPQKLPNGPEFGNLKDHAHRHSELHPNAYYNEAVRHTNTGNKFQFRHDGQNKNAFITRTGDDSFTITSTSVNGRRIFTHMEDVPSQYLRNIGITLPNGF